MYLLCLHGAVSKPCLPILIANVANVARFSLVNILLVGVLLGILGGGVPPGSSNPDPLSDQKVSFFTPVFRPGLKELTRTYVIIHRSEH